MAFTPTEPGTLDRSRCRARGCEGDRRRGLAPIAVAATVTASGSPDRRRGSLRTARPLQAPRRRAACGLPAELKAAGWKAGSSSTTTPSSTARPRIRRGLGWFGKERRTSSSARKGLVVRPRFRRHRCAPLGASNGPVDDGCGSCRRCIDSCPTGAIVAPGSRRCPQMPRAGSVQSPGVFPKGARVALGNRLYGCDECQEGVARRTSWPISRSTPTTPTTTRVPAPGVDVARLCSPRPTRRCFRAATAAGGIPDRQVRYLRRNALIILGNTGDGREPGRGGAARTCLADPDDLLAPTPRWACIQLDPMLGLLALVADDPSPLVHASSRAGVLVTNGFPPSSTVGSRPISGRLWRRLPPDDVTVLTTPHPDARAWDAAQAVSRR